MTDNFYKKSIFSTKMEDIEINPFNPNNPDAGILRKIDPVPHKRLAEFGDDLLRNPEGTSSKTMDDERRELTDD